MIQDRDFDVAVAYDAAGPRVGVTHQPTGRTREGRPSKAESIGHLQVRFRQEIKAEFFNPRDFELLTGRASDEDNTIGDFYRATHTPSGKSRIYHRRDVPDLRYPHFHLIDEILTELWNEGFFEN